MMRKDNEIKWKPEVKWYFEDIKKDYSESPVLVSLDFSKYFLIFSFASKHTMAGVLLQRNHEGNEKPIAFYN